MSLEDIDMNTISVSDVLETLEKTSGKAGMDSTSVWLFASELTGLSTDRLRSLTERRMEDAQPHTWAVSSVRKWLNEDFLAAAFSAKELDAILTSCIQTPGNLDSDIYKFRQATKDKVFLLSAEEVDRYLPAYNDRKCAPTPHAVKNYAHVSSLDYGSCWWWLRTPGEKEARAAYVFSNGSISMHGDDVGQDNNCVRPALWADMSSGVFLSGNPNEVIFGNYAGDPIRWSVLDIKGTKALLLAKYGIEAVPFDTDR